MKNGDNLITDKLRLQDLVGCDIEQSGVSQRRKGGSHGQFRVLPVVVVEEEEKICAIHYGTLERPKQGAGTANMDTDWEKIPGCKLNRVANAVTKTKRPSVSEGGALIHKMGIKRMNR